MIVPLSFVLVPLNERPCLHRFCYREKDYHRHESFHSLIGTKAEEHLHLEDLEVDDDEWQISAWFLRDQAKEHPLATLDFQQNLFAVTGTFRAQQRNEGFVVFPRNHFMAMFGPMPSSLNSFDELMVCPYTYNSDNKEWINSITGGNPLVFHFAGNDWLCACSIFAADGFQGITGKFRENCHTEYAKWSDRVQNGVQWVAHAEDPETELILFEGGDQTTERRRLRLDHLTVSPYSPIPESSDAPIYEFGPYTVALFDDPYRRNLRDGPYRRNPHA
jgi:hypothetical protein